MGFENVLGLMAEGGSFGSVESGCDQQGWRSWLSKILKDVKLLEMENAPSIANVKRFTRCPSLKQTSFMAWSIGLVICPNNRNRVANLPKLGWRKLE